MKRLLLVLVTGLAVASAAVAAPDVRNAAKARVEGGYATVLFKDGQRAIYPIKTLTPDQVAFLEQVARTAPLSRGKVTVEAHTQPAHIPKRETIAKREKQGSVETVELHLPGKVRDQGNAPTCQFHALAHALDIAGYFVDADRLVQYARVPLKTPEQQQTRRQLLAGDYGYGSTAIFTAWAVEAAARFCPQAKYHTLSWREETRRAFEAATKRATPATLLREQMSVIVPQANWEWVRNEIRQGRPVVGALGDGTWRVLPPAFFETHLAPPLDEGHAIVIHGFTWDEAQQRGSFLLINSWDAHPQLTVTTEEARGVLFGCFSISPKGRI